MQEKSSTQMKTIVTTIQHEQNEIIRDTQSDLLFVQGAAGSGKTSAIMQRMAYLLYRYRGNLNSADILMFSPNQLFNDYVKNVLPEMGESNMVQFTLESFVGRRLPGLTIINVLDSWEGQFADISRKITHLLASEAFFDVIENYAKKLNHQGVKFRSIIFNKKEIMPAEKIEQIFYQFNNNYKLINRLDETKKLVLKQIKSILGRQKKSNWVSSQIESMSEEEFRSQNPRNREFSSSSEEYNFYATKIVNREYEKIAHKVNRNFFLNIMSQYRDLLRTVGEDQSLLTKYNLTKKDWQQYLTEVKELLSKKSMTINEALPFIHLFDLLTGRHGELGIRYVFVDEIQDYTPYQIRYLRKSFPRARFTLLGDLNQEIFSFDEGKYLVDEVKKIFSKEKTRVINLPTSYRSTKQITNFTKEILHDGETIKAFDRDGKLPTVFLADGFNEADRKLIELLRKEQNENYTTAVITKSLEEATKVAEALENEKIDRLLIQSAKQHLGKKVIVIPSYLAKGLEFDVVIAYNISESTFNQGYERKLLYTLCSRAMHELNIISVDEMSPLLTKIPKKLYQIEKLKEV